jgi:hypothetical protein
MLPRAALAAFASSLALVSGAPLQCGHTPDAELQEDETPGDALWALAQRFHDTHDVPAERATLRYLVEHYPASRWVPHARESLAALGEDGGGA